MALSAINFVLNLKTKQMETLKKVLIIYEFIPLAFDRTSNLLNKLGHSIKLSQPLLVADIFNLEISNNYEPKFRKAVGFGN